MLNLFFRQSNISNDLECSKESSKYLSNSTFSSTVVTLAISFLYFEKCPSSSSTFLLLYLPYQFKSRAEPTRTGLDIVQARPLNFKARKDLPKFKPRLLLKFKAHPSAGCPRSKGGLSGL